MKLAHHTIRNMLLPLFIIMVVWAGIFYVLVLVEFDDETNDTLENYKEIIIQRAKTDSTFVFNQSNIMSGYTTREISEEEAILSEDVIYDATKYIGIEREFEPIRVLRTHFLSSDNKYYELVLETSILEKEDLMETIAWSLIILYITLLACLLWIIHAVFKKSFRPLYTILEWLRQYHPGRQTKPLINETIVEEFETLNKALVETTERSTHLYAQQKQFVENASHELQTPLAVCMNKLELLSENPDCTEEQLKEIDCIHRTLQGIIKVNKSLLLLSRIDNKQFPDTTLVSLTEKIQVTAEEFAEIYESKDIRIQVKRADPLRFLMNESLADTLIKNLIKNAFVHNRSQGEINIEIGKDFVCIENTSDSPALDVDKLFTRFGKQSSRSESTGLGLALVKSISLLYGIGLSYTYNSKHQFVLTFR